MKLVFADTVYWIAVLNPRDALSSAAKAAREAVGQAILVTTEEVLAEFLNAMSRSAALRKAAVKAVREILKNPNVKVIPQSRDSFQQALERYADRLDKTYSLTDCSSMNAMDAKGIRDVLTHDRHFAQEGYNVLIHRQP